MTSTTSSAKWQGFAHTYRWNLARLRDISIVYTVLLFLVLPIGTVIALESASHRMKSPYSGYGINGYTYQQAVTDMANGFYRGAFIAIIIIAALFALVISIALFRYMHKKRSVDLFHSLPVSRTAMLLGRVLAGFTALVAPIVLNLGLAAFCCLLYGVGLAPYLLLVEGFLWLLLMLAAIFSFCSLAAICSGGSGDMVFSILGINICWPLILLMVTSISSLLLPGLSDANLHGAVVTALSPFSALFMPFLSIASQNFTDYLGSLPAFIIWWVLFTALMVGGCIFFYRRRKSEVAETPFAFAAPIAIVRFLVTATCGLALGLLLHSMEASPFFFFLGVLLGSFAAHLIAQSIFDHGLRHFKRSLVPYGGFVALFLVFYFVLATGFFGYDQRVPNANDVESVTLNNQTDVYIRLGNGPNAGRNFSPVLTDPEDIQNVTEFHKFASDYFRNERFPYSMRESYGPSYSLTYKMKDGSTMNREYVSSWDETVKALFYEQAKDIYNSETYKKASSSAFYLEPSYISRLEISSDTMSMVYPGSHSFYSELIAAMREDVLDHDTPIEGARAITESGDSGEESPYAPRYLTFNCEDIQPVDGLLKTYLEKNKIADKPHLQLYTSFYLNQDTPKTMAVLQKYRIEDEIQRAAATSGDSDGNPLELDGPEYAPAV